MSDRLVDLRSDTVTLPTPEMRRAISAADLGDDVFGEDPTVCRLEALAADRLGKEAAVLVSSGTQGNLVGVLSHTQRGDEVIVGDQSHVLHYEVAGCAVVGGLQLRSVHTVDGMLDPAEVEAAIRPPNVHHPRTSVVCVENTHNRHSGAVLDAAQMHAIAEVAHRHGVAVHLDGARIFNAAVACGVDVRALTAEADSVTFCLSKGLSAPVGSVLCGRKEYVETARKYRKLLGGGMRQAGIIAAAGIVALTTMVDRLADDHENARILAEGLAELPGIALDPSKIRTNIVIFDVSAAIGADELVARLKDSGVLCNVAAPGRIRMVTHHGIVQADVERAIRAADGALSGVPIGAR
ncbi:MAG TPA: low-specificity L-threonine aldolase [Chloroflexota bacterium]|nr:low-specificity L-threonine aldolase [Chloroflexota bacterium]